MSNKKEHWENVYNTKNDDEVSWYQDIPKTSLDLILQLEVDKKKPLIDVGGGNSNLAGELQKQGYVNLSVLDISEKALERTQNKLGEEAEKIQWIVTDILDFKPKQTFNIWHDRAVFHFLTKETDIAAYINLVGNAVKKEGYFILATFSKSGPLKCSGLDITQYSKDELAELFNDKFTLLKSFEEVHQTPFNTEQNFIYTIFQRQ